MEQYKQEFIEFLLFSIQNHLSQNCDNLFVARRRKHLYNET